MYTLDASVLINASERQEADHADSRTLMRRLHTRRIPIILPTLALVEVAGFVARTRTPDRALRLVRLYRRLAALTLIPLDDLLGTRAIQLAANQRLRGADAVYAAVAQAHGTTLVSRDGEHLTRLAGIVPVQTPAEALAMLSPAAP